MVFVVYFYFYLFKAIFFAFAQTHDNSQPALAAPGATHVAARLRGFKVLRVYGNDPRLSHEAFLSRCTALGLKVIVAPWAEDAEPTVRL